MGGSVLETVSSKQTYPGTLYEYVTGNCKQKTFESFNEHNQTKKVFTNYFHKSIYKKFRTALKKNQFYVINGTHEKIIKKLKTYKDIRRPVIFFPWNWLNGINSGVKDLENFYIELKKNFEPRNQNSIITEASSNYDKLRFLDGLILVGHSAGGVIAQLFAARNPQINVFRIITVASPFEGVQDSLDVLTVKNQNTNIPWYSAYQILQLSQKFSFVYDFLPANTAVEQHLDDSRVESANELKEQISEALSKNSSRFASIFIYNMQYRHTFECSSIGSVIIKFAPILGDNVVISKLRLNENSYTIFLNTKTPHRFLLNCPETISHILKALH